MRAHFIFLGILGLLLIPGIFADEGDVNSYQEIELKISNDIEFGIDKDEDYRLESFFLTSYFYPIDIDGGQELEAFSSTQTPYQIEELTGTASLIFPYSEDTLQEDNSVFNSFTVSSQVHKPTVQNKISYPINRVSDDDEQYLEFRRFIDVDDSIRSKASELAQGEDDVYIIASKVAKWIREDVNYDLSTLTANPNQTSTQVFQSKQGVCREITNLYVSMMRSLGIPARVVTGFSYTNSDELVDLLGSNWGGHAWAEVLIGDEWVPFDLTYNQYGYVDASHIVLDRYVEIRPNSVSINGTGFGFNIRSNSLSSDTSFEILDAVEQSYDSGFEISLEGPTEIGFDSYGYIRAKITNEHNYYQVLFLQLAAPTQAQLLDSEQKMLIFEPNEEKVVHFKYKIPDTLDSGFIYTFPFTVYNDIISENFDVVVREDALAIKELALPEDQERSVSLSEEKLQFSCEGVPQGRENVYTCFIKNTNNYIIEDLEVCSSSLCQTISLNLNEEKTVVFTSTQGKETMTYSYDEGDGSLEVETLFPTLNLAWGINTSILTLNYTIQEYQEDMDVNLYLNGQILESLQSESELLIFELPVGNSTVEITLSQEDKVFENQLFKVEVTEEDIKKDNFITSFIKWFLNLF